jgi:hypothetical protein
MTARSISASITSSAATPSATVNAANASTFDLATLLEGNQKFREQKSELTAALAERMCRYSFRKPLLSLHDLTLQHRGSCSSGARITGAFSGLE